MRSTSDPVTVPLGTDAPPSAATRVAAQVQQWSDRAWAFDYYAALRRLESIAGDTPRWGCALLPSAEPLRVGQAPSLSFAPASFSSFHVGGRLPVAQLKQLFFGYVGPNGPLPVHLSDFIRERALNHGDPTWLAFLDCFAHRFSLHLYRAWANARPAVGLDRPGQDNFRRHVGALVGIGMPARQQRDAIHDDARLHFSGWLIRRVHSAEGVESVLGTYFGVPVRLERWVGHWMPVPEQETTRLGAKNRSPASRSLGGGALMGRSVWDRQHRVRLHLGPLRMVQYHEFLPVGGARPVLQRWMQQLLSEELEWDAQLVLRKEDVPPTRLGARRGNAPRLGWVSWLGERPRPHDAADVRIARSSHTTTPALAIKG